MAGRPWPTRADPQRETAMHTDGVGVDFRLFQTVVGETVKTGQKGENQAAGRRGCSKSVKS